MKVEDLSSGKKASEKMMKLGELVNESDEEDHGDAMEKGAASQMRSKSRNSDQPSSRKWLFHRRDYKIHKTSVPLPYNIPDIYLAIVEFQNPPMREKFKVESEKEKVISEASLEKVVGSSVVSKKFDDDTSALEKVKPFSKNVIDNIPVLQPIIVDEYHSPAMNVVLPNPIVGVIFMDAPDPNVCNKNNDKKRGRKRSSYLDVLWKRRSQGKVGYCHDIGLIPTEFFNCDGAVPTPITAETFRALCTEENRISTVGKPLHYKGSTLHRVVPGYMVYGGYITNKNGTIGESIYGSSFANESFVKKHTSPGQWPKLAQEATGSGSSFIPVRLSGSIANKSSLVRWSKDLTS
ncbi:hypothetical protein Ddye_021165 [Dipteronia dyeriana]|uniref:PPIase cyclophilin-type domain-containing protein n=1 Tax=Dipteronia dyeriana TaxID=168575 RepID=A0AAD9U250_9ROSI|nr:hypothetical protein Ddye_021165 [Dipteronia dyeriana]